MFLNYIKRLLVKKLLKNSLHNIENNSFSTKIKTIGLVVDESHFSETKTLVKELVSSGVLEENIEVIVYKNKEKTANEYSKVVFGSKDLNWGAKISNSDVKEFIKKEFDLLISYYDVERLILLIITNESKAKFKAGFASIDHRLNNLMINTFIENDKVFIQELIKYLKILNKI